MEHCHTLMCVYVQKLWYTPQIIDGFSRKPAHFGAFVDVPWTHVWRLPSAYPSFLLGLHHIFLRSNALSYPSRTRGGQPGGRDTTN